MSVYLPIDRSIDLSIGGNKPYMSVDLSIHRSIGGNKPGEGTQAGTPQHYNIITRLTN